MPEHNKTTGNFGERPILEELTFNLEMESTVVDSTSRPNPPVASPEQDKKIAETGMAAIGGNISPGTFHWGGKGWCRWGWFEDVVLNTFFGFVGEGAGFRTQIRSYSVHKDTQLPAPNRCRHDPAYLYTIDKRVILPGRFFPIPDETYLEEKIGVNEETIEKYKQLQGFHDAINDKFSDHLFAPNGQSGVGYIRNFVFSADFLIKHFGSGISDLESGLNSFWRSVSSIYGGFWNFEVKQSQSNTGRIGIIDNWVAENKVGDATIFPKLERKSTYEQYKNVGTDPDKADPQKTFEFSVYSKDSILSEFSVDVTIDSKMITQAMYHTNKDISTVGHSGMNSPESMGIQALSTLHNVSKTKKELDDYAKLQEERDSIVYEITTPYLKGMMSYSNNDGELKLQDIETIDLVTKQLANATDNANQLIKEKKWREGATWVDMTKKKKYLVYDIHGRMHKPLVRGMLFHLNKTTAAKRAVDPIVPLSVSFSLQGIAGITIGDMFAIDYLPDVYRQYALFQVSSVGHEIGTEGWKTTVEAIMRIDMENLLKDDSYTSEVEQLSEEELAKRRPAWLSTEEQRLFIDAIDAELALAAEETHHKNLNIVQKLNPFLGDAPSEILNVGVTMEQAGLEWVELKEIEDELRLIHMKMKCVSIDQVRRVLTLSGESLFEDITNAGREANLQIAKGMTDTAEYNRLKRHIKASELLEYVNIQAGKANTIRGIVFNDIDKKGYSYKRPQKIARGSTKGPEMRSKDMIWMPRLFYTRVMEIEEGLEGFKNSGGGEGGKLEDWNPSAKALAKRYKSIDFTYDFNSRLAFGLKEYWGAKPL